MAPGVAFVPVEVEPVPVKPRLRGVSHQVAALVFPLMGLALVVAARTSGQKLAVGVYTLGVTAMYATSALYHRGSWAPAAKRRARRLDHSMILVGTASTYTPVFAIGVPGTEALVVLSVVWALALVGAVLRNVWLDAPRWLTAAIYIAVGWTAVVVLPSMWSKLGVAIFALIMGGGLLYTLGAVVYSRQRPDPVPDVFGYHEVFHALVLMAGLSFYVAVCVVVAKA